MWGPHPAPQLWGQHQPPHRILLAWRGWEDWGFIPLPTAPPFSCGAGQPPVHPKPPMGPHRAGVTCHGCSGWAGGVCGSVPRCGGSGDPSNVPSQCHLSTVPLLSAGGFYAPAWGWRHLGGGGLEHVPPFPELPSFLDAMMMMMMDGRRAVALGPPPVPSRISGYRAGQGQFNRGLLVPLVSPFSPSTPGIRVGARC